MSGDKKSEARILREVLLAVGSKPTMKIFRNSVGVAIYPDGSRVTYGLIEGASDIIGMKSILIGREHVGRTIAQFLAVECKSAKGRATEEQRRFLAAVTSAGGLAGIVRSADEALALVDAPW